MASSWPCVVVDTAFPCRVLPVPGTRVCGGALDSSIRAVCLGPQPVCSEQPGSCPALAHMARLLSGFPGQGLLGSAFMVPELLP